MQHHAKICRFLPTAPTFPLQHRGIHKHRPTVGQAEASSTAPAGAEPNIRRRAASVAWSLQKYGALRIGGPDPE